MRHVDDSVQLRLRFSQKSKNFEDPVLKSYPFADARAVLFLTLPLPFQMCCTVSKVVQKSRLSESFMDSELRLHDLSSKVLRELRGVK